MYNFSKVWNVETLRAARGKKILPMLRVVTLEEASAADRVASRPHQGKCPLAPTCLDEVLCSFAQWFSERRMAPMDNRSPFTEDFRCEFLYEISDVCLQFFVRPGQVNPNAGQALRDCHVQYLNDLKCRLLRAITPRVVFLTPG